ncbi:hypothetical protein [Natrononativus amylolyticus]|uniref:hypothetical protein n=1 Tax=Natrononativus amylolyticus TaxID=2963434 RepID=UPI0020CD9BB9|nr:hypothetical protein [Natrononativus amylolyticus]
MTLTREEQIRKNRHDLIRLAEAIEALEEYKRTKRKMKARKLRKRRENAEEIERLQERLEQVAKQSGVDLREGDERETEKGMLELTDEVKFFTPESRRPENRYMTENPYEDR